ncbi:MAG: NADH:flavin oxidoreductase [Chlorobiaceae bacterium]|jgi:2,4-dienoyl-CoA reductase-like NADH-dependent reductase (Old Yellow Enzyme family)|nr:NADH:flavin oxidoreductase [Chlorobiaceae bacterium]
MLFDSCDLGGIAMRNRILRSATHESLADASGAPGPGHDRLYSAIARGGAGAIITGYAGVRQDGRSSLPGMLMMDDDRLVQAYRKLTGSVHRNGAPLIMQLAHCGRQTRSKITGMPTVAPSVMRDGIFNEDLPVELSESGILEIARSFADAAVRARNAGFDGVQLHMAHGYLLSQFLSGYGNRRTDRWGGSTENRFRIIREIMRRIRSLLPHYPVLAKINGFDQRPGGMRIPESVRIAQLLEASGCTAIEVSSGTVEEGLTIMRGPRIPAEALLSCNFRFESLPKPLRPLLAQAIRMALPKPKLLHGYNFEAAAAIRKAVSIPVIAVGGLHTLDDLLAPLMNGFSDFVSMSRPFIIEPDIVRILQDGRRDASRCTMCNHCAIMIEAAPLRCWHGMLPGRYYRTE